MDVLMVGPWMRSMRNGLDPGQIHGLHSKRLDHGRAMHALHLTRIRLWMSSFLGCIGERMHCTHRLYHGLAMDAPGNWSNGPHHRRPFSVDK